MTQFYTQDISDALGKCAVSEADLHKIVQGVEGRIQQFIAEIKQGDRPAFSTVLTEDALNECAGIAKLMHHEHIVVLGVGGSSLGAQTLLNFKGLFGMHHKRVRFVENVDPQSMAMLAQKIPLEKTCFLVVSKSGGTLDTLLPLMLFVEELNARGLILKEHIIGITEPENNPLRAFLASENIPTFEHDPKIGGRFSVFSIVGLLPATLADVDIAKVKQGAASVLQAFLENPLSCIPAIGAAFSVAASRKGKNMQVMMPYSDRLRKFSNWYVQLWAESVGKNGVGSTPIPAVGSTDQHSFLQLMMAGPDDKVVNIINPVPDESQPLPTSLVEKLGQNYLAGIPVGEILHTQAIGTIEALQHAGRIVRVFKTDPLSAEIVGALMMHFMLETVVACFILEVDPWGQEDVEDSKKRTKASLSDILHT